MSRRRKNRGARLVASFAVLGVVLALGAGLRAASAATNGFNTKSSGKVVHADNGPSAKDFISINRVKPNVQDVSDGQKASTGTFVAECGTNADHHNNPDNVIVAPGVADGAQHTHDYVGNTTT